MVTINDIAEKAGVAKSTVSRYLNGGSVSKKTSEKIERIINETGFVPNTFARSLKAKESKMIGAILPRLDSDAANTILKGVDNYLRENGYRMTIVNTNLNAQLEIDAIRHFQVNKMDGIIFLMTHFDDAINQAVERATIPIVAIGQESDLTDCVYFNEIAAGEQLATYLYEKGHRSLTFLKSTATDPAIGIYRRQGVIEKFKSFGDTTYTEIECGFRSQEAYEMVKQSVLPQTPSLIVASTDIMALGAMRAALEVGIKIPKDLSIVGFGNHSASAAVFPGLTTINYPYEKAGEIAAKQLIDRLKNIDIVQHIELETQLIERESVKDINKK